MTSRSEQFLSQARRASRKARECIKQYMAERAARPNTAWGEKSRFYPLKALAMPLATARLIFSQ